MNKTAKDIMNIAIKEIGTKELPANSNNVKYNTWYYGNTVSGSAYPWCCAFVNWIFDKAGASSLFYDGKKTAYCPTVESWGKSNKLTIDKSKGQYGDIVLFDFYDKGISCHIGLIVQKNSNGTYKTIEGNTAIGNNDNGGSVMYRTRNQASIRCIIRPKYGTGTKDTKTSITKTANTKRKTTSSFSAKTTFIKGVQKSCGAKADGIAGSETLFKTVTVSAKKNNKHAVVKYLQTYLNYLGYDCGIVDGIAGTKFTAAVKKYQKTNGCVADGEITAKCKTWKILLGLE